MTDKQDKRKPDVTTEDDYHTGKSGGVSMGDRGGRGGVSAASGQEEVQRDAELLSFMEITGCVDTDIARYYLIEACGGNVESAVDLYLETGGNRQVPPTEDTSHVTRSANRTHTSSTQPVGETRQRSKIQGRGAGGRIEGGSSIRPPSIQQERRGKHKQRRTRGGQGEGSSGVQSEDGGWEEDEVRAADPVFVQQLIERGRDGGSSGDGYRVPSTEPGVNSMSSSELENTEGAQEANLHAVVACNCKA
eukprot:GHVQ01022947.1.p1 GENE.GHVQ01022947.1~~GHVQ01022947.1.p1  ORF type:complete len:248 (-),score=66.07 GHVQ01022947.1:338-1081(-)